MRKQGKVLYKNLYAGIIWQDENGYGFQYDKHYLNSQAPFPVSLTLPLREEPYLSNTMIPFFDGLIPEGWLLEITVKNWKVNRNDRMEILLIACKDCIGAVSIERIKDVASNEE
ncbi:HipA N-terminal domain-containing protein [Longitalea luteola]|uniref:HipA N-terminal domain-containing protein n=1 Tax=Longitalea luteola TaxID=2812563 RepID=UPI001A979641|nr:HipA N-terminal domain-containing protein [Longitalea luteola]